MTRFHKHMTPREFSLGKTLLENGLPMRRIAAVIDRSVATVCNIKKATDWEGYQRNTLEATKALRVKRGGMAPRPVPSTKEAVLAQLKDIQTLVSQLETLFA